MQESISGIADAAPHVAGAFGCLMRSAKPANQFHERISAVLQTFWASMSACLPPASTRMRMLQGPLLQTALLSVCAPLLTSGWLTLTMPSSSSLIARRGRRQLVLAFSRIAAAIGGSAICPRTSWCWLVAGCALWSLAWLGRPSNHRWAGILAMLSLTSLHPLLQCWRWHSAALMMLLCPHCLAQMLWCT